MNGHNRLHFTANRQWIMWEPSRLQGRLAKPVFMVCGSSSRKSASWVICQWQKWTITDTDLTYKMHYLLVNFSRLFECAGVGVSVRAKAKVWRPADERTLHVYRQCEQYGASHRLPSQLFAFFDPLKQQEHLEERATWET